MAGRAAHRGRPHTSLPRCSVHTVLLSSSSSPPPIGTPPPRLASRASV
uniref:Uncharacterized protein n=1 Tax=Arundo donax TaxID=35708 RepID=A0A0A8YN72_ARUDO